jgi:hypothetical protein
LFSLKRHEREAAMFRDKRRQEARRADLLRQEVQARRRQVEAALRPLLDEPETEDDSPIRRVFASFQGEFPNANT